MAERKRPKSNNKARAGASGSSRDTSPPADSATKPAPAGAMKPSEDVARPPHAEADPALSAGACSKRRRTRLVGVLLFAGVVVGAALYGLWPMIMDEVRTGPPVETASVEAAPVGASAPQPPLPEISPPGPATGNAALDVRLDALEQSLTGLAAPQVAILDTLAERIAVLEANGGASPSPEATALAARLDEIDARLALGGTVANDQASEALADELAALGKTLAALTLRLGALEVDQAARPDPGVGPIALVLGLAQLRDALARGAPFAAELAGVVPLLAERPDAPAALAALEPYAEYGVPTREALRARFPALARAVVTAALAPEGAGWVDETLQKLADVVSVRRTGDDIEGDSAEARIARAEVRLVASELAGAVAELDGLEGAAREAAQGWLSDARARLDAEDAVALLGRVVAASFVATPGEAGVP